MKAFDVYKLWPIEPVKAEGSAVWDKDGIKYLDMYGGHAVISVGHAHPLYNKIVKDQLDKISFYSNSVLNSLQTELAERLGRVSGYEDFSLFLSNSGAEANENALKLASFHTGKSKILAFKGAFHGRSSGAVAVTDIPKIVSPFNSFHQVVFVPMNDIEAVKSHLQAGDFAAVIVEGIQGVAGIYEPDINFLKELKKLTSGLGVVLILDEVQSGYGRTGKFFAHQHSGIEPDIITTAKGMGNGFPIGGTLISPMFKPVQGMLGTTFGGNHLACAAAIAVLRIIEEEGLVANAQKVGDYLMHRLCEIKSKYGNEVISDIRGRGLIVGIDMTDKFIPVRDDLLFKEKIFTGGAKSNIIRLLPPLNITNKECDVFLDSFVKCIETIKKELK
ncbi:MAG: acetylornithine aminotransferase [Bacteroidetes bacterium GWE2_39_28]|nr:MAG: acetylornithine aminotransferase [Bacteroidetes bacterium GWE2_39_28]OFY14754.1 MAG: acetylornithine aminotransferase [Bacteroidetes bacterium GWF2_39_10]OFZ10409.1 MAG: acetylornithine aminotransferase [Bacteroidetes bacterium RIFOXYC2_FULL_39_11]HCT93613.1 aspartate aminotransferase family protein [Rikenellaceae bacterium]